MHKFDIDLIFNYVYIENISVLKAGKSQWAWILSLLKTVQSSRHWKMSVLNTVKSEVNTVELCLYWKLSIVHEALIMFELKTVYTSASGLSQNCELWASNYAYA